MQKVRELSAPQSLSLNYEKSVAFITGTTPNIKLDSGTVNSPYMQLPNLPIGQKYKYLAHTHPNISGGTYSVFSFDDW